jgi:hypothetical protein
MIKILPGGPMPKKKLYRLLFFLFQFVLLSMGCDAAKDQWNNLTSSGSGSGTSSSSQTTSQEVPAHGQETVNLLEKSPFKGKELDPAFWSNMEAYCKAGPTKLIIADMNLVPSQMSRAGFTARWAAQCYALATTYMGWNWNPGDDPDGQFLYENREQMYAWWARYVQAVVNLMKKAPKTTAVIIINDGPDRLGSRLGDATMRDMTAVQDRVTLGDVIR